MESTFIMRKTMFLASLTHTIPVNPVVFAGNLSVQAQKALMYDLTIVNIWNAIPIKISTRNMVE
ncbi:hypothetical protein [Leyella lascolaii]|jgi:hypothetical protein|uniref:Uncharacterized protein n=1 Tax=Leyella lascolaii TaxID=1776379 RepID=A0AAW7JFL8_9BACT|nr:hypothetical protein [Leyella lascolaii]MDN0021579.1 hypothetical protein [Leyella lascolaii]MDN0024075.1 hypothetical protein [Leyella lascolaii]CCZ15263.1 unknown [Prevotella sp. CAG:487]